MSLRRFWLFKESTNCCVINCISMYRWRGGANPPLPSKEFVPYKPNYLMKYQIFVEHVLY